MSFRSVTHSILARTQSWIRAATHRRRLEAEMEAELADHLAHLEADLVRAGHSAEEARRRAGVTLGPALMHKESMRASLGLHWWDECRADLRYAIRMLRKDPGFTAIVAISLALAIGANTAIFSVTRELLYQRISVPHAKGLRLLEWVGDEHFGCHAMWGEFDSVPGGMRGSVYPYPAFKALETWNHDQGRVMEALFAFKDDSMNATIAGLAQRIPVEMVSGSYYAGLGVHTQLGRGITPADDSAPLREPVAVISDALWDRSFGRSPAVLGRQITVSQVPLTIVGVNPPGFTGAKSALASPDVFVPISMQPAIDPKPGRVSQLEDPELWWINVMGRVDRGTSENQARAALQVEVESILRGMIAVHPTDTMPRVLLSDGSRGLHVMDGVFRKPLRVLLGFTGLVLLLACANVANLMLARGARRRREMGMRMALGAGRSRIVRQMLVESVALAMLGGAGGLCAGFLGAVLIPRLLQNSWEGSAPEMRIDWSVFAFTAAVTFATGLLFGIAPALAASRSALAHDLKENAPTFAGRRQRWGGKSLAAFQVALSTLLIVGAALFVRTFVLLSAVHAGFRTDHLLLAEVNPPRGSYPRGGDVALHQRIEQSFAALPGVDAAAPGGPFLADNGNREGLLREGESPDPNRDQGEFFSVTGNDFFRTMDIPILAGRGFNSRDTATSAKVAVVNGRLARERFPGENPIGKRFRLFFGQPESKQEWIEIVGVCGDTRYLNLRNDPPAQFFVPYVQQDEAGGMTYNIRTALKSDALVPAMQAALKKIDPNLPLVNVRTQEQQIASNLQQERLFVAATSSFGLLALALASVGIYGVMAYSVSQRTSEIGIRLAMGARPAQVRGMILRESSWLTGTGVAAGLGAALLLVRAVRSMLYGVGPHDPATLGAVAALLSAVALAASWIPARRAAGVHPMEALRHE